jgi:hypothetical protein
MAATIDETNGNFVNADILRAPSESKGQQDRD